MRYKIDAPEGYAPSSNVRKNSKGSSAINTANGPQGTGEAFSHTNSVSTSQLNNTASNLSGQVVAGSKQSGDKRISSAPPNRYPKIYSREVSVPKLFGELAHLDDELQVCCILSCLL